MPVNLAYRVHQLFWGALDWIFPPNCGGCGAPGAKWCKDCAQKTVTIRPPICQICGNPHITNDSCDRCQSSKPYYASLRSYAVFGGVIRTAIHKFKYQHDIGLGETLAGLMIPSIEKLNWPLDIVTSVPLGLVRLKERGYNQATLLARPIALYFRLPFSPRVLSRTKETKTQVGLTVNERQENMKGAFKAEGKVSEGKTILVIDDVATSGATLNSCAKALLDEGAVKVYGFSLARAVFSPDGVIDLM